MKTNTTLKAKVMSILLVLAMLTGMLPMAVFAANAPSYVALGDSISTGYGLASKDTECFTYQLALEYGYELTDLAVDGNTTAGIIEQLKTDEVKTAVKNADFITITVGGNDLMALLYQAMADQYNRNHAKMINASDIPQMMTDRSNPDFMSLVNYAMGLLNPAADIYLIDDPAFNDAIVAFVDSLNQITSDILALNEDANIIVTTQYNPYVEFNGYSYQYIIFSIDLTPIYAGMEAGVTALNTAIKDNATQGGYTVADVKAAFDNYSGTNDLYNADPTTLSIDFHPTADGHTLIAEAIRLVNPDTPRIPKPQTPEFYYSNYERAYVAILNLDLRAYEYVYELYEEGKSEPVEAGVIEAYYKIQDLYFDYALVSGKTYKLRIKALGNSDFSESEWSDYAVLEYYHYLPIVVRDKLLNHGDKYEISEDSYAIYEGEKGNAVLRLHNLNLTVDDIDDVEALPNLNDSGGYRDSIINTHLDDLTIILEGDNSINCGIDNYRMLTVDGNITITSENNGSLTLYSEEINVSGIRTNEGMVSIENCTVDITSTATSIRTDMMNFSNCDVVLRAVNTDSTVLPYYYSYNTIVNLEGCIAIAGADESNTEVFEKMMPGYKYMKVVVPDIILSEPEIIEVVGTSVSWTPVENAVAYDVELYEVYWGEQYRAGKAYGITDTYYDFDTYLSPGAEYYFRIRAVGDGTDIATSQWAESDMYRISDMFIGYKNMLDKQYMYNDGTLSMDPPADPDMGYAVFEVGEEYTTLTLNNFNYTADEDIDLIVECGNDLVIDLIGDNTLAAPANEYSCGIHIASDFSLGMTDFEERELRITGEKGSTLTIDVEELAYASGGPLGIIVDEGVTLTTDAHTYCDSLTVNGKLYINYGSLTVYGILTRGSNGYISVVISEDEEYGAIEQYFGEDEPVGYDISDYITLNGGEVVDENGKPLTFAHYLYSYEDLEYPEYSYQNYVLTFFDPDIAASERNGDNSAKNVIICSKGETKPKFTVEASCTKYWGTTEGSGEYEEGSTVILKAIPSDGVKFEYWLDGSVEFEDDPTEAQLRAAILSYDAEYEFTVTEDVNAIAVFSVSTEINIVPMIITGTDEDSLLNSEWLDIEGDYKYIVPGSQPISLPGDYIDDVITVNGVSYVFEGFIETSYDFDTDTSSACLKSTLVIEPTPHYESAEYWDWRAKYGDGIYPAYMMVDGGDTSAPRIYVDNYDVFITDADNIRDIRFALGEYTNPSQVKAAEGNVALSNSVVVKNTANGRFEYEMPDGGYYTFWIRMKDGNEYFLYADMTKMQQEVVADGVTVTVKNLYGVKDFFIAEGDYDTYAELKPNYLVNISSNKIGTKHEYTYTVKNPGIHTVLVRYNDSSIAHKIFKINLTVDEPTFTTNGLQVTIGNIPDVKVIRTAYGEYYTPGDTKRAEGARNFSNKSVIKNAEEYTIQYRDEGMITIVVEYNNGYVKVFHYEVQQKTPTVKQNENTITFGDLEGLNIIRYAKGEYTTVKDIKAATGTRFLKASDIVDGCITVELEPGTYTFYVQYDDESYNYYTIKVE